MVAHAETAECKVGYTVTGQSSDTFTADVVVTNLGDTVSPWTLQWSFTAGQRVTSGWNGVFSQNEDTVSVTNARRMARLRTSRSVTVGFTATWSGSNPVPTAFALNGASCGDASGSTDDPTTAPDASASVQPPADAETPPVSDAASGWDPPSSLATALAEVWSHQESTYTDLYGFQNYGWDQVMANKGHINYCVRWDSAAPVSTTLRDQIHTAIQRQFKHWMDQMVEDGAGWNAFPYTEVPVAVVGWAVRDRSTLQWSDDSVDIYVNDIREDAPQCAEPCGRFFHQDGNYGNCPGGESHHYDMSLWLTSGFSGGHGGDWGQRVGSEYFVDSVNEDDIHIVLHELGHTFGLDDFYDWTPTGTSGFLMKAGTATQITDFDRWMLRDWWRHLASRYGY
ncbi:MAG: cellulose-binding protein [Dactylosporangium sp.]|nr:cellulose-binding protein [Dactylosporangium sp.]